jgi:hypothetical protein
VADAGNALGVYRGRFHEDLLAGTQPKRGALQIERPMLSSNLGFDGVVAGLGAVTTQSKPVRVRKLLPRCHMAMTYRNDATQQEITSIDQISTA